ncbi:hypothetical protein FQN60_018148 [Etheostoma spectabile]|uniref:Uncharacterized protein n=1 Tax=Etheostoma spectabile TaxID=54343 RepID=A0A5J5DHF9_9PERO|nr:hypothetical protein FQN60_018148 [Etheostoma spectabile]
MDEDQRLHFSFILCLLQALTLSAISNCVYKCTFVQLKLYIQKYMLYNIREKLLCCGIMASGSEPPTPGENDKQHSANTCFEHWILKPASWSSYEVISLTCSTQGNGALCWWVVVRYLFDYVPDLLQDWSIFIRKSFLHIYDTVT